MVSSVFGLHSHQIHRALESAGRAPSLLNSQPWAFLLADDHIDLHLDTRRSLPAADPVDRQARIACGGALFNLRLALARYGVEVDITVLPEGSTGPLARLARSGPAQPNRRRSELDRAIPHRRSNRRPFFAAQVSINFQHVLAQAAAAEGATLHLIADAGWLDRIRLWALDAHRRQLADPAWVAERAEWTTDPHPAHELSRWAPTVPTPDAQPTDDGGDSGEHPLIGILTTITDTEARQVAAGQALESALLSATGLGLSMSTLPELIEVPLARHRIGRQLGTDDFPQAVVRLGFDGPVRASPRRPVDECLIDGPVAAVAR